MIRIIFKPLLYHVYHHKDHTRSINAFDSEWSICRRTGRSSNGTMQKDSMQLSRRLTWSILKWYILMRLLKRDAWYEIVCGSWRPSISRKLSSTVYRVIPQRKLFYPWNLLQVNLENSSMYFRQFVVIIAITHGGSQILEKLLATKAVAILSQRWWKIYRMPLMQRCNPRKLFSSRYYNSNEMLY